MRRKEKVSVHAREKDEAGLLGCVCRGIRELMAYSCWVGAVGRPAGLLVQLELAFSCVLGLAYWAHKNWPWSLGDH